MNPDDVVEAFVTTIIIGVMLVVTTYIVSPDIGKNLIGILPVFVELMIYLLLIGTVLAMLYQIVDQI